MVGVVRQPRILFAAIIASVVDLYFLNDPDQAVRRLDAAMNETDYYALEPNERDDVRLAGLYGRAERGDRARELIAAHERDVLKSSDVADRNAPVWGAYGNISMGEARYDDAVEEFTQARDLATGCAICFRTELAQAFLAAGQVEAAVSTYEECLNRTDG